MQARDVMTREVVTVGPETSAGYAAEVMAEHGFAALPVVDGDGRLVGIVAEADVLRDRMPPDPRLHLRRNAPLRPLHALSWPLGGTGCPVAVVVVPVGADEHRGADQGPG